jgi:hypothetical protein
LSKKDEAIAAREQVRLPPDHAASMLPGAIASIITTRGRKRAKSMPASTSASPLHVDLEEVDLVEPASAHSAASVRTGLRIVL